MFGRLMIPSIKTSLDPIKGWGILEVTQVFRETLLTLPDEGSGIWKTDLK